MSKGLWRKVLTIGIIIAILCGAKGYKLGTMLWDNFEPKTFKHS